MKFFSKKEEEKPSFASDVMEVVEKGYPKVVQEIHHEFMNAGDKLLKTANELLDTLSVPNHEKVAKLKQFGFHQTKQVSETAETQKKINVQKKISDVISNFRVEYPNYKYITIEIAEKICAKYNLVLGPVGRFTGFVPQKNIDEMEAFFNQYPNDKTVYTKTWYSTSVYREDQVHFISEKEYNTYMDAKKNQLTAGVGMQYQSALQSQASVAAQYAQAQREPFYSNINVPLAICVPLKDMDMRNMKLEGVHMVKDVPIPDPVVLMPKNHSNGTVGYLILTAWGDEASDPMVVNQNKN